MDDEPVYPDDVPKCPRCGKELIWYLDTLVCVVCDRLVLEDLWYQYQVRRGRYEQK